MVRRTANWTAGLAKDLRNPVVAREYILAAIGEGLPLQVALADTIRSSGVKEFAEKIGMPAPNLHRALRPGANPTLSTLNRLLAPFKLELTVAPSRKRRAA